MFVVTKINMAFCRGFPKTHAETLIHGLMINMHKPLTHRII